MANNFAFPLLFIDCSGSVARRTMKSRFVQDRSLRSSDL